MNIRSIDLQVLIPHAAEVSKTQHIANQQNAVQQQDFANQWQRIAQNRQQQVQTVNHTDGGKVHEKQDQPEKHGGKKKPAHHGRSQGRNEQSEQQPQSTSTNSILGRTIDIKT